MRIRAASSVDFREIARVHVDSWKETYTRILPQAHLDDLGYRGREGLWRGLDFDRTPTFLADEAGEVAGFVSGGAERSAGPDYSGELYAIYLLRAHHGRGLGRKLVRHLTAALHDRGIDSMLLWVLSANSSRGFYEHLGGVAIGTQRITIFDADFEETAYGWRDTEPLRR